MSFKLKTSLLLCAATLATSLSAAEVEIDSYGYAGALYNQGFLGNNKNHSVIGLSARAGANFYFDYGLSAGLSAAGAWAALDNKKGSFGGFGDSPYTSSRYPNTGDVADAFLKWANSNVSVAFGRFDASFLEFDWLSNSIQGIGFNYKNLYRNNIVNKMDIWLTYFNSFISTGYQPNRIGSELGTMYAYHPGSRDNFIGKSGGNVVAAGLNMNLAGFVLDPYLLVDTSVAGSNDVLFQVGTRFGYIVDFARDWRSSTILRVMLQIAPNYDGINGSDLGFLAWADQEFKYSEWVKFGLGLFFSGGQNIWTINDNTRFYGKWTNSYTNNYFSKDSFSAYIFSSFDLISNKLGIDLLFAGGNYTEFSAILKYTAWQGKTMKADIGGGYVYYSNARKVGNIISKASGDNLLVFTKLSY